MERIFALVAIGLGTLSGGIAFILAIFGKLTIPLDIWFSYLVLLITIFMTYVYWWFEENAKIIKTIANTPYAGLEIFRDSQTFLERVAQLTVGSNAVSTINLSDTPETFRHLSKYFSAVHKAISSDEKMKSFRRIAGLQSQEKAIWLLRSSASLIGSSKLSAAFVDSRMPDNVDLCLHIVERSEGCYTFIFPSVDLTGKMPAILIKNDLVAHALSNHFDSLWHKNTTVLHEGQRLNRSAFAMIEDWFPKISNDSEYRELKEKLCSPPVQQTAELKSE